MNILLHICCSNCSLYPLKLLRSGNHNITGFWFNPNIHPLEEYRSRLASLKKLSDVWQVDIDYAEKYAPEEYFKALNVPKESALCQNNVNGLMNSSSRSGDFNIPPAPDRCRACYQLRLEKTAEKAREDGYDAFTTTLLISPYQDSEQISNAGARCAETYNIMFHMEDFRPFFREAMDLAKEVGLYRQKYCGCIFSKEERYKKNDKIQISNNK
ncbi:MAG: epoxyqueuosine reductase QueH [Nitrospiraceae bacterium]|nr:MAG: epoxyqueuosine reductase QueH [Nitrospiraceae bacterium]